VKEPIRIEAIRIGAVAIAVARDSYWAAAPCLATW
jgi:hypothetical protein